MKEILKFVTMLLVVATVVSAAGCTGKTKTVNNTTTSTATNVSTGPGGPDWRHKSMEYEETYYGHHIIVTTLQQPEGDWKSKAELLDSEKRVPLGNTSDERYPSEEEAKRAALSIAAGAIDQTRISKGKP